MRADRFCPVFLFAVVTLLCVQTVNAQNEKSIERQWLDTMSDIKNWEYSIPETKVTAHSIGLVNPTTTLKFANRIDFNDSDDYEDLIGWPRVWLNLEDKKLNDWSEYELLEFYVYAETSVSKLPTDPLWLGLYHDDKSKNASAFWLNEVEIGKWVKFQFPVSKIKTPANVTRLQFSISEANYQDRDVVNFYITPPCLIRYSQNVIGDIQLEKKVVYTNDAELVAKYSLSGPKVIPKSIQIEMALIDSVKKSHGLIREDAKSHGEMSFRLSNLKPGEYIVRTRLKDSSKYVVDEKISKLRVIEGPF